MKNPNHWMTYTRELLAGWYVEVPAPAARVETLLRLADRIVAAGEQERVFRILRAPTQPPFIAGSGVTYGGHLARLVEQTSALCLFSPPAPPWCEDWLTSARLAFFAPDGSVVEDEIDDVGALLRRLRPESVEDRGSFMRSVSPVFIGSGAFPVSSGSNGDLGRPVHINIWLETDIWFPRVLGMLEDRPDAGEPPAPEMYDNAALAAVHTPRFNRFLGAVREAATEAGGRFLLSEIDGLGSNYTEMCSLAGILLPGLPPG